MEKELTELQRQCGRFRKLMIGFGTVSVAALMFGLVGTVIGMIRAFDTMGIEGGAAPEKLSGDIRIAMLTTALGIVIAVPSVILCISFLIIYLKKKHRLALFTPPPE